MNHFQAVCTFPRPEFLHRLLHTYYETQNKSSKSQGRAETGTARNLVNPASIPASIFFSSTARSPTTNRHVMHCDRFSQPGIIPTPYIVRAPQKPGRACWPELCISSTCMHFCQISDTQAAPSAGTDQHPHETHQVSAYLALCVLAMSRARDRAARRVARCCSFRETVRHVPACIRSADRMR